MFWDPALQNRWMSLDPWKRSRPGRAGLGTTCGRCPCPCQGVELGELPGPFQPNPTHPVWEGTESLSPFSLPPASQWAVLMCAPLLCPAAHAGDVFRGGHSQEVLLHDPRCCAVWAEGGCSAHRDVPGAAAVPGLRELCLTTPTSQILLQLCGEGFCFLSVRSRAAFYLFY